MTNAQVINMQKVFFQQQRPKLTSYCSLRTAVYM